VAIIGVKIISKIVNGHHYLNKYNVVLYLEVITRRRCAGRSYRLT